VVKVEKSKAYIKGETDGKNDLELGFPWANPGVSADYDLGYKNAYRDAGIV